MVTQEVICLVYRRSANFYYPKTLKNSLNEKGNAVYKLDQMAPLNGIQHDDAHSAIGDCIATMEIVKIIFKKALNVWKASQLTTDKIKTMDIIKKEVIFFVWTNFLREKQDLLLRLLFVNTQFINGQMF